MESKCPDIGLPPGKRPDLKQYGRLRHLVLI